jgi:FKBP-type peptidyl-prolyl cis-trans isomerase FklB
MIMNNIKHFVLPFVITALYSLLFGLPIAQASNHRNTDLSYAIGFEMGKSFKDNAIKISPEYFTRGVREGLSNTRTPYLTQDKIAKVLKRFRDISITEKQAALKVLAQKNLAIGKRFLKANAHKPGIITLHGGIQYKILQNGSSMRKPNRNNSVVVTYIAQHLNGKVFDQAQRSVFQVSSVIAGWQQILPMMNVGDYWKVYIPSHLAYGPEGALDIVGPNETLIYDIHLIGIA